MLEGLFARKIRRMASHLKKQEAHVTLRTRTESYPSGYRFSGCPFVVFEIFVPTACLGKEATDHESACRRR
jgi:hypothetical protein